MDIEKLIEQLHIAGAGNPENIFDVAANALSALWAENAKLRAELEHKKELVGQQAKELERRDKLLKEQEAELEQMKQLYESEKENFIDFARSGVPNLSPYCMNRRPDCVDERGWCRIEKCYGFRRERGQKED